MDYVEGKTLPQLGFPDDPRWKGWPRKLKTRLRGQLADVYVQLRGLEFSSIGALGLPTKPPSSAVTEPLGRRNGNGAEKDPRSANGSFADSPGITVRHQPMPVELVMQEVEGRSRERIIPPRKTFKKSNDCSDALMPLTDNNLDKGTDMRFDSRGAREDIYTLHDFQRFVTEEWLDPLNVGPFVLMHGDLSFHGSNLLWDKDYKLVAVLDWEWSYTVPVQHFVPPRWLVGFYGVPGLTTQRSTWMCEMLAFRRAIKAREKVHGSPPHLSDEWAKMEKWPHILIALALLRPETIYHVYWGFLTCHISGLKEDPEHDMVKHSEITTERVDAFLRDTPSAEVLVARKVEAQRIFVDEFER